MSITILTTKWREVSSYNLGSNFAKFVQYFFRPYIVAEMCKRNRRLIDAVPRGGRWIPFSCGGVYRCWMWSDNSVSYPDLNTSIRLSGDCDTSKRSAVQRDLSSHTSHSLLLKTQTRPFSDCCVRHRSATTLGRVSKTKATAPNFCLLQEKLWVYAQIEWALHALCC
jgi:hypothetical protein